MKTQSRDKILTVVEGAAMIALAIVTDLLLGLIPSQPQGGSFSIAVVPILFFAYRRGTAAGITASLAWSVTQLLTGGFYVPPANTVLAIVACLFLDYIFPFGIAGIGALIAKPFGRYRIAGYGVGAFSVCLARYISHVLSGVLLYGSYAPEGMNVWIYSIGYSATYMVPNTVFAVVLITALCIALDPKTLRPRKKA